MFSRGIVAAMEDEAQAAELAIDATGSDSMEAGLVEVVDMSADIDAGTTEMAQTVSDADQLERHVEVLSDAEGEGGASPELVEATEIAVESIYARLGIYSGTGIPALEAFSTKTGRARATRVAIEDISGKIKQIWEAVKAAFTKLVNFVKDFFGKLLDTKKRMLARITALEVKAKAVKGTKKEDAVKASGVSGVFSDATSIPEFLGRDFVNEGMNAATGMLAEVSTLVSGVESQASFDGVKAAAATGADSAGSAPDGMKWVVIASVGNTNIISLGGKTTVSGKAAYEVYAKAQVKTVKAQSAAKAAETFQALDQATMTKYLASSREVVKATMEGKANEASISKELDKAIADINRAMAMGDKGDEAVTVRGNAARSAVTNLASTGVKLVVALNSETLTAVQAVLTYVERSINNFSEEVKKDEKK